MARRLERAEATANARFVEARARLAPGLGAQWIEVAGAYAMFDGPASPCTQTFGLGLFQMPSPADMDRIEAFFKDRGAPVLQGLEVRVVGAGDRDLWARTAAEGWREVAEFDDLMLELMRATAARQDGTAFLVELDGRAIADGAVANHKGVALLAGASTIPEFRRRGAQSLLLEARLDYARQAGCDLAMMCAEPGSASQRNAERQGFRIAYTRIKFGLKA